MHWCGSADRREYRQCHQLRQPAFLGGLDLSAILPELRLDIGQPDGGKDFLLGAPAYPFIVSENPILVDLEAPRLPKLPNMDVVVFRTGEIVQRSAIALGGNDANIRLHARLQRNSGACRSLGSDFGDFLERNEVLDDGLALGAGHEQVQVADGLLATPVAARHHDLLDTGTALHIGA